MEDIAKVAGVSRATVSLVVRNSPLVADQTRQRVAQVMADLDYVRNIGAAKLRSNNSHTIGVVVPNLVNSFFTEFLGGVEHVMGQHDRVVLLANSKDDPHIQDEILQRFRGHGVDGVILCPAEGTQTDLPQRMRSWGLPLVQALRHVGGDQTDYAGADYVNGVGLALRYLVELGHKRIAFLSVPAHTSARDDRLRGFHLALQETGAENAGILEADLKWGGAGGAVDALMALPTKPTAVLCFNDVLAAGLMLDLRRAGYKPGRDISVIGLDDLPMAELAFPPLTTVAMHPNLIGAGAARLLARRLAEPDAVPDHYTQAPNFVARESVADLRA
ncbi:LacI family transcriptional regulator (plasmid) [Ketogulonicigenium robustum]|uniref:LacI family transcriptional regulator n=1 Tax=Ketogulonicigenium robustum TaxID=92947 RepID=A0A1W6P3C8_9RHOB|nr:LacI family transcriptional regulator [Ketogulonicigenium robustum]